MKKRKARDLIHKLSLGEFPKIFKRQKIPSLTYSCSIWVFLYFWTWMLFTRKKRDQAASVKNVKEPVSPTRSTAGEACIQEPTRLEQPLLVHFSTSNTDWMQQRCFPFMTCSYIQHLLVSSAVYWTAQSTFCATQTYNVFPLRQDKGQTKLTAVRLLADVILGPSSLPNVDRVTSCQHFAIVDNQGHFINGVNGSIQATPRQRDAGATVKHHQCLTAEIQRQARGRGNVE